jgi:hypothetical protein
VCRPHLEIIHNAYAAGSSRSRPIVEKSLQTLDSLLDHGDGLDHIELMARLGVVAARDAGADLAPVGQFRERGEGIGDIDRIAKSKEPKLPCRA